MTDFIPKFPDSPALQEFRLRLAEEYSWLLEEIQKKNLTIKTLTEERDKAINALTEERDELVRITDKLAAERDDARALYCGVLELYKRGDGREEAKKRGWFCFKENSNE